MGWLIALGVLLFLLFLPIGVSVRYDAAGPHAYLLVGAIHLSVFPIKKRKKKEGALKKEKPAAQKQKPAGKTGGSLTDFSPLVQICLDFLGDFGRKLRVNRLEMKLIFAGGDPCDLAINYGRAWAAVGNLVPRLEQIFVIKSRNIEIECDFTSETTRIFARLDLSITIVRLFVLAGYHGIHVLREYVRIMNKRKGGAKI